MKHIFPWWLFFWLMFFPLSGSAVTQIIGWHLQEARGYSTLVLDLDGQVGINLFPLANPHRVVLDLSGAVIKNPQQINTLRNILIRGVRAGFQNDGRLRIVLDVTRPLLPRSYFTGDNKNSRLVIELRDAAGAPSAPPPPPPKILVKSTPPPPVIRPQPVIRAPLVLRPIIPSSPPPASIARKEKMVVKPVAKIIKERESAPKILASPAADTLQNNSHPVATSSEEKVAALSSVFNPPETKGRQIVVAVDAGHGGKDPGAIGPQGTEEKTVTLAIARRVAELLRRERGMRPLLIRNGDYFVALRERIQQARAAKADLFISIHADAVHDSSVTGASVYVLSERGASSEAARFLAEKENAVDLVGGIHLEGRDNNLARTLLDMSQTATLDASFTVASRLLANIEKIGNLSRNSVERAGFLVLKSPDIPSVLVETAYLSNPDEEEKLRSPYYQQTIANAIMKGVRAYFIRNPPSGTMLAQSVEADSMELARRTQ